MRSRPALTATPAAPSRSAVARARLCALRLRRGCAADAPRAHSCSVLVHAHPALASRAAVLHADLFADLLLISPSPPRLRRPFRQWYEAHYGVSVGKKKKKEGEEKEETKKSNSVTKKIATRQDGRVLDPNVNAQFDTGRLYACISSRPGQCGRCDGFILEGKELEFYVKRMARKKK